MNLGERVECGRFTASNIGLADKKVASIIAQALDATSITLNGADLSTTLSDLAGGSATADWANITNKPANLVDWTTDQGDTNINVNNLPLLNYAPNSLASNGTAGLTNYNFNEARKNKLASIEVDAQVNVQPDWNATSGGALILNKPTWIPQSDPGYLTAVPSSITDAITLNTAKVGITTQQADAIVANTLKVGITSQQEDAISVNTLKVGITTQQANAIVANTLKVGITTQQEDAISVNTLKTGITVQQANAIVANTAKLGAGQAVGNTDSPTFNQLTLGNSGVNQSIINLQDFTNIGTDSIAQIKGLLNGSNGGELRFLTKDNNGSLSERLSMINGIAVFKGIGINVNTDDNLQQGQIYNSLVGDKDLAIDAYSGVTDKGISFRTSSGTNRMRIKKNGNVGINTTDPTHQFEVNGDIKGDNLILGAYGETPKIDMLFAQGSNTSVGYDKRITIGSAEDFPNTINFPAHPPSNSMGINIQNNSDGFFIGIEEYLSGEYRPLLKWGDDATDTPFVISNSYNNKKFEFGVDGKLTVPGVIKGESGTICKVHILPFSDSDSNTISQSSFTSVVSKTFTKTAGTNLFGEIKVEFAFGGGHGNDTYEARLTLYTTNPISGISTSITGDSYSILYTGHGGGGHRSNSMSALAVYSNGSGVNNSGSTTVTLQARRDNADDDIDFKQGFFKVTEIWA